MGKTHPKHHSPFNGTLGQLALLVIVTFCFVAAGQHPYLRMGVALFGMGVLGIVLLQCLTSHGESIWSTAVAPLLGGVSMFAAFVLMIDNYAVMTGSDQWWVNHLPLVFLLAPLLAFIGMASARPGEAVQH